MNTQQSSNSSNNRTVAHGGHKNTTDPSSRTVPEEPKSRALPRLEPSALFSAMFLWTRPVLLLPRGRSPASQAHLNRKGHEAPSTKPRCPCRQTVCATQIESASATSLSR